MGAILAFILTPIGRWAAGAASVLLLVWTFGAHKERQGAAKAVAKIEKQTNTDINRARSAGQKSASGWGGVPLQFRD